MATVTALALRNETGIRPALPHFVAGQEFELAPTELPHVHVWDSEAPTVDTLVIRDDRMYIGQAHSCAMCGMLTTDNGRTWGQPHMAAIPAIMPAAPKATVTTVSSYAEETAPATKGFGMRLLLNLLVGMAVTAYALSTGLALVMALGLMTGTLIAPNAWFRAKPRAQRVVGAASDLSTFGYCRVYAWWLANQPIVWRRKAHRMALMSFVAITLILASF